MLVEIEELKKDVETTPIETIESVVSSVNTRGFFISWKSFKDELRTAELKRFVYSQKPLYFVTEHNENEDVAGSEFSNLEIMDKEVLDLLSSLYENQKQKTYQVCMYKIYDQFGAWQKNKWYSKCDNFLKYIEAEDFDVRILLSLLMASLPMKKNLNYRREFYDSVLQRARLVYSSAEIDSIFVGLD